MNTILLNQMLVMETLKPPQTQLPKIGFITMLIVLFTFCMPESANAVTPSQGVAWPDIQSKIDVLAENLITNHNLPGVSIAASKNGKLVVSRAYGFANTDTGDLLNSDFQIHMGSTTKVLITGPTVLLAMSEAGLDPETAFLYGPTGIYGTTFDEDISIGADATGTPIDWYYQITVQHLLDHAAGFNGASSAGTLELFGIEQEELTYELIHKHFLRTKALQFEPGTSIDYDNHHFGSMKLIVETLSGIDFVDYVALNHLGPWGLNDEIEIIDNLPGLKTADPHTYEDGEPIPYVADYSDSTGFAAGGYRGSTRDVVELMTRLAETYTPNELDLMGFGNSGVTSDMEWGDDTDAYIAHNGRISGGTSYVRMTVDGINIAIQTNINNSGAKGDLRSATIEIIELLRQANIPSHYDLWANCTLPEFNPGYLQVARHGIPAKSYQCLFDQMTGAGYQLSWLDASTVNNVSFFNVMFVPATGEGWRAFHGLSGAKYQQLFTELVEKGFRPVQVDSYLSGSKVLYTSYFTKTRGSAFVAYHGVTVSDHQNRFDDLTAKGYRPTSLSVVSINGNKRYTAVYEKGLPGSFFVKSTLTPTQYQSMFNQQSRLGRRPVYLNGYNDTNGNARLVAIFSSLPNKTFRARHGLTSAQYQIEWNDATADGFLTDVVTAYQNGRGARYAAIWSK